DRSVRCQVDGAAFGAAADGARQVQIGRDPTAARQGEALEGRQRGVEFVDLVLELLDVPRRYPRLPGGHVFRQGRQRRAEIEELVLDSLEYRVEPRAPGLGSRLYLINAAHE